MESEHIFDSYDIRSGRAEAGGGLDNEGGTVL